MRTYSPSALPHLVLAAVVLVVPLPVAFAVAAGFAAGRWTMPVASDAWSDDGARIARDLPDLLRVPARLRSCRDPDLHAAHPGLPAEVRACRTSAVGTVGADGSVRWHRGLRARRRCSGSSAPARCPARQVS